MNTHDTARAIIEAGAVDVSQMDRDSAARLMRRSRLSLKEMVAADMEEGRADDDEIVKAFARHRILATLPAAKEG